MISIRDRKIYVNQEMAGRGIRAAGQAGWSEVIIPKRVMKEWFTIEIA